MFERFTERARRVIFFARDEAGHLGSPVIDTEHFLLAYFREDPDLMKRAAPTLSADAVLAVLPETSRKILHHVDMPISPAMKKVLSYGNYEAELLGSREITHEHLLMGLLHLDDCAATKLLIGGGAHLEDLRKGRRGAKA